MWGLAKVPPTREGGTGLFSTALCGYIWKNILVIKLFDIAPPEVIRQGDGTRYWGSKAIRIDPIIGEDATAASVAGALEQENGTAEVIVNSPGGSATERAAIFAEIRAHPAPITIRVRGIAASAASLLVMAGDTITIAPAASMMLHDPAAITIGNADQHRASLATLEELSSIYAQTHAEASGQPVELVRQWMRAESWLSPQDAVTLGFADRIEPEPAPQPAPERQTETMRALTALAVKADTRPVATFTQPVVTL